MSRGGKSIFSAPIIYSVGSVCERSLWSPVVSTKGLTISETRIFSLVEEDANLLGCEVDHRLVRLVPLHLARVQVSSWIFREMTAATVQALMTGQVVRSDGAVSHMFRTVLPPRLQRVFPPGIHPRASRG